jgi:hypothetical protein
MVFDGFATVREVVVGSGGGAVGPGTDWGRDCVCVAHAARDIARQMQMAVCATSALNRQFLSVTGLYLRVIRNLFRVRNRGPLFRQR